MARVVLVGPRRLLVAPGRRLVGLLVLLVVGLRRRRRGRVVAASGRRARAVGCTCYLFLLRVDGSV